MYEIDQEKVKKDFQRVLKWYDDQGYPDVYSQTFKDSFSNNEDTIRVAYLSKITDLSEDYIRKYFKDQKKRNFAFEYMCSHQTNLSEQFYKDFLDELNNLCKVNLIKYGRVSSEFIKKHSEAFDQKVWEYVYQEYSWEEGYQDV